MEIVLRSGNKTAALNFPTDSVVMPVVRGNRESLKNALAAPLELPPVSNCVVPGDKVTVVADPQTPELPAVLGEVCRQLLDAASELNLTILLPQVPAVRAPDGLLKKIADVVDPTVNVHVHDAADDQQRRYLASSTAGERIYLSQHLVDSDLNVTVGTIGFDSLLGHSGTSSLFYPAFSDAETIQQHREVICAGEAVPSKQFSRETIDEVGWLLGSQFAVQVLPASDGSIAHVVCGNAEQVMERGIEWLEENWHFQVPTLADVAVISVDCANGNGWEPLGRSLSLAASVVEQGGRIAVVADLGGDYGPALEMLKRCADPADLINPLRLEPVEDASETLQLISALRHADVYLFSDLPTAEVEEFGLVPLANESELQRLIDRANCPLAIRSANFAMADTQSAARINE